MLQQSFAAGSSIAHGTSVTLLFYPGNKKDFDKNLKKAHSEIRNGKQKWLLVLL